MWRRVVGKNTNKAREELDWLFFIFLAYKFNKINYNREGQKCNSRNIGGSTTDNSFSLYWTCYSLLYPSLAVASSAH